MSCELISHSPDLEALRRDGYEVGIVDNHVVLRNVPYVNAQRVVLRGTLMTPLTLAGDRTDTPGTHVVYFAGEYPCQRDGTPIEALRHSSERTALGPNLIADHSFSNKPSAGFPDYETLLRSYATILEGPAAALDPNATARTGRVVELSEDESVFRYPDTSTSRAGIGKAVESLALADVAIVGLGGTGSYILDLVAKTPVKRIHLFDDDDFLTHNAFRSPGAATLDELRTRPRKVAYLAERYAPMRRGIHPHPIRIDASNVGQLAKMSVVFISVDDGPTRRLIVDALIEAGVSFVDVGMGVLQVDDRLLATVRVSASTPQQPNDFDVRREMHFAPAMKDDYDTNIQIADLNALNAVLAVIRWKKAAGFYADHEYEHHSTFTTNTHLLTSSGCA